MDADIGREQDENGLRWYEDGDRRYMSVTTVLGFLDEDDTGLTYWKENNQGEGDDKHWQHIFWYSAPRGTLCHYHALNPLADRELWSEEEQESLEQVRDGPQRPDPCLLHDDHQTDCCRCKDGAFADSEASYDETDIVYSLLHNHDVVNSRDQYHGLLDDVSLSAVALQDISWVADAFADIKPTLGITDDSLIAVEKYLLTDVSTGTGYGGQCDLLYEDASGNVVMADLKTSSSLRQSHVIQTVAYSAAVEATDGLPDTVDRREVIKLDPDDKAVTVHTDEVPEHADGESVYDSDQYFSDQYGDYQFDSIDEMYDTFVACLERATDSQS